MGSSHSKVLRSSTKSDSRRDSTSTTAVISADTNFTREASETIAVAPTPSSGMNMPVETHPEVDDLRQQLDGKNELIAALVAELEQVVEQLDRVKRNGTDRPRASGGGGAALPADVVEEHQQVLGEMQRVVQEWEQMQTASSLGRIESELADLRAMLSSGFVPRSEGLTAPSDDNLDSVMSRLSGDSHESSSMVTLSGTDWEAMKRQMLGDSGEESTEEVEDDLVKLLAQTASPAPLDVDNASVEALRKACAERDTYIVQITRWIRTRRAVTIPENWAEIDVPEDLRAKAEELTSRLEEQVRLAEVEMSLERARLSREKSQVQSDRAVIDKHMKRLGISSLDELEDIAVSSSSTGDRRWMRFLGVNRKS